MVPKTIKGISTKEIKNHLERLGKEFGVKNLEDWYQIETKEITSKEKEFFSLFKNSLSRALQKIYPKHDWHVWKFDRIPSGYWKKEKNVKRYFDWLGRDLGLKNVEGWYDVKTSQVNAKGGSNLLLHFKGSLSSALPIAYPKQEVSSVFFVFLFVFVCFNILSFSSFSLCLWSDYSFFLFFLSLSLV